jgi:hypothetical protein
MTHKCKRCHKEFTLKKINIYCSRYCDECKQYFKRIEKEKKAKAESCKRCGKRLTEHQILCKRVFCCDECDVRFLIQKNREFRDKLGLD